MLKDYIKEDLIFINPDVNDKKELFRFLTATLGKKGLIHSNKAFFRSLLEREQIGNTEIMPHIAIPHAHCMAAKKLFIAVVISKKGIIYNNPENDPANTVFLIGCPSGNNKEYLQLLATVARMIRIPGLCEEMQSCKKPSEVIDLLKAHDLYDAPIAGKENRLMIISLYQSNMLGELMSAMIEVGVGNASIVSSVSMAKKLSYEIPIFAGLHLRSHTKDMETSVIYATISDKEIPAKLAALMKEQGLDFDKPGNGFIKVFKLALILGHSDEFI